MGVHEGRWGRRAELARTNKINECCIGNFSTIAVIVMVVDHDFDCVRAGARIWVS